MSSATEWVAGIPGGCLSIDSVKNCITVRFARPVTPLTKLFSYSKYENEEDALEAAREHQQKISDAYSLTKNRVRFPRDEDGVLYVEMELQKIPGDEGHYIVKFDLDDLDLTESDTAWYANRNEGNYYVQRKIVKDGKRTGQNMHNLFCPEWSIVDHISRDGLDNRGSNLRDGSDSVNENNRKLSRHNTSGINGVKRPGGQNPSWRAFWRESGVEHSKSFSIRKYGEDEARQLAIEYRKAHDEEVGCKNGM